MNYVLGIDQSTQGTKVLVLDAQGKIAGMASRPHRQIISPEGWVSHDLDEIYRNVIICVKDAVAAAGIDPGEVAGVGISNQRETTAIWHRDGTPYAHAVVWQCARAADIAQRHAADAALIQERTGLRLSPFYPAAKLQWLMENALPDRRAGDLRMGTIDCFLVDRLTKGKSYTTDATNASRTQLYNLREGCWDADLCNLFGVEIGQLPEIMDSNADFWKTDFEGVLPHPVPIRAVMGDSHAALYGQGCHTPGSVKATYGTGSSVMMNTGITIFSDSTLASSVAFQINGITSYCLEGNINYSGAVMTWLKDDLKLFATIEEAEELATQANPQDHTVLIPAFTGLSAPYWNSSVQAAFLFMSRTTGQAELVRAAVNSIAHQVTDVLEQMRKVASIPISHLMVDGGPTANQYLMQFQSDLLGCSVSVPAQKELSAIGAARLAAVTLGVMDPDVMTQDADRRRYEPQMDEAVRQEHRTRWEKAVGLLLGGGI